MTSICRQNPVWTCQQGGYEDWHVSLVPDQMAMLADLFLFAGAWSQGRLLRLDPATGVVLFDVDVTGSGGNNHLADLAVDPITGSLWATRGNSTGGGRVLIILNPETGVATFLLSPQTGSVIPAIAIDDEGTLFASLDGDQLAIVDKQTGAVTLIGTGFGGPKISGLGFQR